jgi:REP element-mobilizing transposase RayT
MSRRPRADTPGTWHHVVNRGIARRALFEDKRDVRHFLSRLAREVRHARLELHAWCILTTHFHLLVRSPSGQLSAALQRAQCDYTRSFNRRHKRDGTLVRGRFLSRPVDSRAYRWHLVRYIDANPVQAGIVDRAREYPFGSAHHYARRCGPPWSTRSWIEGEVMDRIRFLARASDVFVPPLDPHSDYQPDHYELAFPPLTHARGLRWVERRMTRAAHSDPLDLLVAGSPTRVRQWMERKARLADGTSVGEAVCDAESVRTVLSKQRGEPAAGSAPTIGTARWSALEACLLRDLACLSWSEIAAASGTSPSTSFQRYQRHASLMFADEGYACLSARLVDEVMEEFFGPTPWPWNQL